MPFTLAEGLADIAPAAALVDKATAIIQAIPPKETAKPSDYIKAVAAILNEAAPLADVVAEQAKS